MKEKHLYAVIYLLGGRVLDKREEAAGKLSLLDENPEELMARLGQDGAEGLFVMDLSTNPTDYERHLELVQKAAKEVDVPVYLGGNMETMDDVCACFSASASGVVLNANTAAERALVAETAKQFPDKDVVLFTTTEPEPEQAELWKQAGASLILADNYEPERKCSIPTVILGNYEKEELKHIFQKEQVSAAASDAFIGSEVCLHEWRHDLKDAGIEIQTLEGRLSFSELKLNKDDMIPVIVQDCRNDEVLMLAYMNEEAWNHTIRTGHMTYYSRSRNELWEKGLTSGHFQYVKSLYADCDKDTLLAKVYQAGAACHTGRRSCFFHEAAGHKNQEKRMIPVSHKS